MSDLKVSITKEKIAVGLIFVSCIIAVIVFITGVGNHSEEKTLKVVGNYIDGVDELNSSMRDYPLFEDYNKDLYTLNETFKVELGVSDYKNLKDTSVYDELLGVVEDYNENILTYKKDSNGYAFYGNLVSLNTLLEGTLKKLSGNTDIVINKGVYDNLHYMNDLANSEVDVLKAYDTIDEELKALQFTHTSPSRRYVNSTKYTIKNLKISVKLMNNGSFIDMLDFTFEEVGPNGSVDITIPVARLEENLNKDLMADNKKSDTEKYKEYKKFEFNSSTVTAKYDLVKAN